MTIPKKALNWVAIVEYAARARSRRDIATPQGVLSEERVRSKWEPWRAENND